MADRIIKIAENNVEVTPSKKLLDVTNKEIEVWDEKNTKSYGQDGIDREKSKALQDLTDAQNLNEVAYKQNVVDAAQAVVDKILTVLSTVPTQEMVDTNGVKFNVYVIPEEYKSVGLSQEGLGTAKKALVDAQNFGTATYKQEQIDKVQARIDRLNKIQLIMDT